MTQVGLIILHVRFITFHVSLPVSRFSELRNLASVSDGTGSMPFENYAILAIDYTAILIDLPKKLNTLSHMTSFYRSAKFVCTPQK
jgi:hypothetical protein